MEEIPQPSVPSSVPQSSKMQNMSFVYVRAVAAEAEVPIHHPEQDFGADMLFSKVLKKNGQFIDYPKIVLPCQIKASKQWEQRGDLIVYDLKARNYKILVNWGYGILVLLCLPANVDEWLVQEEQLSLRKCAYYWLPKDCAETLNTKTVRIFIPRSQMFSADALTMLLNRV